MNIIGFSGKKQSGKTTATMFLSKMTPSVVVCFADGLKNIIRVCFGATFEQLNGTNKEKNTKLACGKTAREMMQIVGTDWFRAMDKDCWVRAMLNKLDRYRTELFIIPDVRFPNEVLFIQGQEKSHKRTGHVIRLLRAPFAGEDEHASETALDDAPEGFFDYVLDNRGMNVDEQNMAIWEVICERKWL